MTLLNFEHIMSQISPFSLQDAQILGCTINSAQFGYGTPDSIKNCRLNCFWDLQYSHHSILNILLPRIMKRHTHVCTIYYLEKLNLINLKRKSFGYNSPPNSPFCNQHRFFLLHGIKCINNTLSILNKRISNDF